MSKAVQNETYVEKYPNTDFEFFKSSDVKIAVRILLILGVTFFSASLGFTYSELEFEKNSLSTSGVVIDLVPTYRNNHSRKSINQSHTLYSALIEYQSPYGETLQHLTSYASYPPAFAIGENVALLVDRSQPNIAIVDRFWAKWLFSVVFGIAGLPLICIGIFIDAKEKKKKKKKAQQ